MGDTCLILTISGMEFLVVRKSGFLGSSGSTKGLGVSIFDGDGFSNW